MSGPRWDGSRHLALLCACDRVEGKPRGQTSLLSCRSLEGLTVCLRAHLDGVRLGGSIQQVQCRIVRRAEVFSSNISASGPWLRQIRHLYRAELVHGRKGWRQVYQQSQTTPLQAIAGYHSSYQNH
ncbi:hypothetical protein EJ05DRAFT_153572 [Pseudovirgaria hyperparasitica]|uniref:Uncharacterized protein n=1 Tax=Pseudovirgaria hyperparasitica TaxID=470096 RepID=A0A6A6VVI7_9PEZI|nr:uncharacterized protein EJ05DRAFT_153572 [Pseudovirgaria hyperparasitica]KAF2754243.1 hypothetical protein EJ05DRAFT_153572 [Pseudovirgaria hyperparasitica]